MPADYVLVRGIVVLVMLACFASYGCHHPSQTAGQLPRLGIPLACAEIEAHINMRDRIETLRAIAKAFSNGCHETVITYGAQAQTEYRYKTFRVLKEAGNIFLPDGMLIDYVLESYERGFLTVLLAASYSHLHKPEAARVEMRRLDQELFTQLYNYGADPVNLLFSAVLWEMLDDHDDAWVDWNRLQGQEDLDEQIRAFASRHRDRLNAERAVPVRWTVYAIGRFPGTDWHIQFVDSSHGYYSVSPQESFAPVCSSKSGVLISTASWFRKIAMRHSHHYHPLLHVQSWIRLPVGIMYSITTFAAGAGIAVGGCALDASAGGDGSLCKASVKGGMVVMSKSREVLDYTLEPDLRHWDNVPASFLFTTAPDVEEESCFAELSDEDQRATTKFFGADDASRLPRSLERR